MLSEYILTARLAFSEGLTVRHGPTVDVASGIKLYAAVCNDNNVPCRNRKARGNGE